MTLEVCGDNRFEIIEKAKQAIIESTNIETSPEEMAVLDNILFRCWQMGWLDKYDNQPNTDGDLVSRRDVLNMIIVADECEPDLGYMHLHKVVENIPSAESTGAMDEAIQKYIEDGYMQPIGEDLISRRDAIEAFYEPKNGGTYAELNDGSEWYMTSKEIYAVLESLPSAPDSRQRGEWVPNHIPDSMLCECDQCGFDCGAYAFNFCPSCGARMYKGGEDE